MLQYLLTWARTLRRDQGQDLAEYALLLALIALVVIVAVTAVGNQVGTVFNAIKDELASVPPGT